MAKVKIDVTVAQLKRLKRNKLVKAYEATFPGKSAKGINKDKLAMDLFRHLNFVDTEANIPEEIEVPASVRIERIRAAERENA